MPLALSMLNKPQSVTCKLCHDTLTPNRMAKGTRSQTIPIAKMICDCPSLDNSGSFPPLGPFPQKSYENEDSSTCHSTGSSSVMGSLCHPSHKMPTRMLSPVRCLFRWNSQCLLRSDEDCLTCHVTGAAFAWLTYLSDANSCSFFGPSFLEIIRVKP